MSKLVRRVLDAGYTTVRADGAGNETAEELPADAGRVILTMPMGRG